MAAKKKSDGGAARANARRVTQNLRTAKKYGIPAATVKKFDTYKNDPKLGSKTEQAALLLSGGAAKVPSYVSSRISRAAIRIGRSFGDDFFAAATSKIKPGSAVPKIKNLRGTVITPLGGGKGGLHVPPVRTPAQIAGTMQGQVTKAARQADQIAALTSQAARRGMVKGATTAGGAGAVGAAGVYAKGRYDENKKNKNRSGGGRGRK